MLFIVVLFHLSPYKNFKTFYLYGIGVQYRECFRDLPHYDRFVSLMPRLFVPLMVLLHSLSGEGRASTSPTHPSSPSATTAASTATRCSTAWWPAARPPWAGFSASSCIS